MAGEFKQLRENLNQQEKRQLRERQHIVGDIRVQTVFEGRTDKLAELEHIVIDARTRLTQICGPVGRGKTTLALHFATQSHQDSFDSVVIASVRERNLRTLDPLFDLLRFTLPHERTDLLEGLRRDQGDLSVKVKTLLQQGIANHKTLIVFNNFEDALDDNRLRDEYTELGLFLAVAASLGQHACQVLLTSRVPLELSSLGRSVNSDLVSLEEGLALEDGVSLLRKLDDGNRGLKSASQEELEEIVRGCAGIPMVLTNLVSTLKDGRNMTLERYLQHPEKLEELKREPARVLYQSLDEPEQQVVQALAIYGKAVPELAVRYLLSELDTETILYGLEQNYVVQYSDTEPPTYSLRPLDQGYAYSQISQPKDLHRQAAGYYRETRKLQEDWRTITDVQPLLDAFEQLIKAEAYDLACAHLTDVDFNYLLLWGHASEVRDLHLPLEGKVSDEKLKAIHLSHLGHAYRALGEVGKAIEYYEQALTIAREIGDRQGKGADLGSLGLAYHDLGEVRKAIEYHEQALTILREIGDRQGEGVDLGSLGNAYYVLGEAEKAVACYIVAYSVLSIIKSPDAKTPIIIMKILRDKHSDFEKRLHSLFPTGDTVLQEATKQPYTFFRDAPPDTPQKILALLDELERQGDR